MDETDSTIFIYFCALFPNALDRLGAVVVGAMAYSTVFLKSLLLRFKLSASPASASITPNCSSTRGARMRASSWTASEGQRHEQGGVASAPTSPPAFRIRTGSPIRYRTVGSTRWIEHTTWQTADFEDGEDYGSGYWLFADREREYLVPAQFIDFYGPLAPKHDAPRKRRYSCPSTGSGRKAPARGEGRHK